MENQGKKYCEYASMLRWAIAKKYGLNYQSSECNHEGSCMGYCWKCDEELKNLQRQLEEKGINDISLDHDLASLMPKEEADSLWECTKAMLREEERRRVLEGRIVSRSADKVFKMRLFDMFKELLNKLFAKRVS